MELLYFDLVVCFAFSLLKNISLFKHSTVTNNIRVQINGEKGFNVFQIGETLEGLLEIIPYSKG